MVKPPDHENAPHRDDWYRPGDVHAAGARYMLIDGTTLDRALRLIIWGRTVEPEPDRRTGEPVFRLLVTEGVRPEAEGKLGTENKPTGEPFEIIQRSSGWRTTESAGFFYPEGNLGRRVGRYTALDPSANSIEIMQAAFRKRIEQLREHATSPPEMRRRREIVRRSLELLDSALVEAETRRD